MAARVCGDSEFCCSKTASTTIKFCWTPLRYVSLVSIRENKLSNLEFNLATYNHP